MLNKIDLVNEEEINEVESRSSQSTDLLIFTPKQYNDPKEPHQYRSIDLEEPRNGSNS